MPTIGSGKMHCFEACASATFSIDFVTMTDCHSMWPQQGPELYTPRGMHRSSILNRARRDDSSALRSRHQAPLCRLGAKTYDQRSELETHRFGDIQAIAVGKYGLHCKVGMTMMLYKMARNTCCLVRVIDEDRVCCLFDDVSWIALVLDWKWRSEGVIRFWVNTWDGTIECAWPGPAFEVDMLVLKLVPQ